MTLGHRVGLAAARARADGHVVRHVTLNREAYESVGLPGREYVYGRNARRCVVWAQSRDHRLIPYVVEATEIPASLDALSPVETV